MKSMPSFSITSISQELSEALSHAWMSTFFPLTFWRILINTSWDEGKVQGEKKTFWEGQRGKGESKGGWLSIFSRVFKFAKFTRADLTWKISPRWVAVGKGMYSLHASQTDGDRSGRSLWQGMWLFEHKTLIDQHVFSWIIGWKGQLRRWLLNGWETGHVKGRREIGEGEFML